MHHAIFRLIAFGEGFNSIDLIPAFDIFYPICWSSSLELYISAFLYHKFFWKFSEISGLIFENFTDSLLRVFLYCRGCRWELRNLWPRKLQRGFWGKSSSLLLEVLSFLRFSRYWFQFRVIARFFLWDLTQEMEANGLKSFPKFKVSIVESQP
jgi:hypothetical protein